MYIDRDGDNNIVAIYAKPQRVDHEFVENAQLFVDPENQIPSEQEQLDLILENITLIGEANTLKQKILNRPGRDAT